MLGRVKPYAHRIDAVPLAGGFPWPIVEDVPQVAAAIGTKRLRADHTMGSVPDVFNGPFHGLVKRRPSTTALKLVVAFKKYCVTGLAMVVPVLKM